MIIKASDVAKYILLKKGAMTTMKLQKLLYYSQAWSLVWDEEPLYKEKIEAWANGPVIKSVFKLHKNKFKINKNQIDGDSSKLSSTQKKTINAVLKFYGDETSQWLSDLTHAEDPWKIARANLDPGQRSEKEITLSSIMEYYSSL